MDWETPRFPAQSQYLQASAHRAVLEASYTLYCVHSMYTPCTHGELALFRAVGNEGASREWGAGAAPTLCRLALYPSCVGGDIAAYPGLHPPTTRHPEPRGAGLNQLPEQHQERPFLEILFGSGSSVPKKRKTGPLLSGARCL